MPVNVTRTDAKQAFEQILPGARQEGMSHYDAVYLELVREGLTLATLDSELQRAANAMGVELPSV